MPPQGGGQDRRSPPPLENQDQLFFATFLPYEVFFVTFLLMWDCFSFFLFVMGAFFPPYGGLLATFSFYGDLFRNVGGSFLFFMEGIFATCPPPPLQKLLGTSMPFLNFFTMQKINFLGWGIHFYKPPSPLNMPLPTG